MTLLLGHSNREVVFSACGILMNMMIEPASRAVLKEAGGIRLLLDGLVNFAQDDWQLAGSSIEMGDQCSMTNLKH